MTKESKEPENTTLGESLTAESFLDEIYKLYQTIKSTDEKAESVAISQLVALIQSSPREAGDDFYRTYKKILSDSNIIHYLNNSDDPESKPKVLRLLRTYFVAVAYLREYLEFKEVQRSIMDVVLNRAEDMGGTASRTTSVAEHVVLSISKAAIGSRIFLYFVHAVSGLYRFFFRFGSLWRAHQDNKNLKIFLRPRLYYSSTFFAALLDLTGAFIWGVACILMIGHTLDINLGGLYSGAKSLLGEIGFAGCLSTSTIGMIVLLATIGMSLEWIAVKALNLIRARYEYDELTELNQDFNPKVGTNGFTLVRDVKKLQYEEKKYHAARDFLIATGMAIFACHFLAPAVVIYACLGVGTVLAIKYDFTLKVCKDVYHGVTSVWEALIASCGYGARPKMSKSMQKLYEEFPPEGQSHDRAALIDESELRLDDNLRADRNPSVAPIPLAKSPPLTEKRSVLPRPTFAS